MTLITDAGASWSAPVALSADEVWQTRKGAVYLTTTSNPAPEDGVKLYEMQAVQLSAGLSVRYRKSGPTEALIVREAI